MKKKSLISMVVALSLTATIMVGATLAYLTAQTDAVTNTFTIGNVSIELEEPSWNPDDAKDLAPGASVDKDPTVTNTGANDAYVAMTVDGMTEMAAIGFSATVNEGWVKISEDGTPVEDWNGALEDGIYAYNTVVAKGAKTAPLFNEVVYGGMSSTTVYTVTGVAVDPANEAAGVYYIIKDANGEQVGTEQFDSESAAKSYIDSNLIDSEVTSFDLVVKAYAIQTKGLEDVAAYTWANEIDFTK